MSARIETLTGEGLKSHLTNLARLRIEVFRDYPYLYDGDHDYERKYLSKLGASAGGIIVGAFDGDVAIGAATGAPLADQSPEILQPFVERGDALSQYFYFGESVLRGSYRGQGIGVRFFNCVRRARGSWASLTPCSVQSCVPSIIPGAPGLMCRSTTSGAIAAMPRLRVIPAGSAGKRKARPRRHPS